MQNLEDVRKEKKIIKRFGIFGKDPKLVANLTLLAFLTVNLLLAGRFWLWNILSILPPILFLLICIISLLLATSTFRKDSLPRILLLLFSVTIIFFYFPLTGIQIPRGGESGGSESIKVFVWNTEYWEDDNDEFYIYLQNQDADVYLLQEFLGTNGEKIEVLGSEERLKLQQHFPRHEIIQAGELITMSRIPISQVYAMESESYLKVDVAIGTEIISFYNVHLPVHMNTFALRNPINFIKDIQKRDLVRKNALEILMNDMHRNENDVFIAGDFNITKSMQQLPSSLLEMKNATHYSTYIYPTTWEIFRFPLWQIDYAFLSQELFVRNFEIINHQGYSDHSAIVVEIGL